MIFLVHVKKCSGYTSHRRALPRFFRESSQTLTNAPINRWKQRENAFLCKKYWKKKEIKIACLFLFFLLLARSIINISPVLLWRYGVTAFYRVFSY